MNVGINLFKNYLQAVTTKNRIMLAYWCMQSEQNMFLVEHVWEGYGTF